VLDLFDMPLLADEGLLRQAAKIEPPAKRPSGEVLRAVWLDLISREADEPLGPFLGWLDEKTNRHAGGHD
jgi:hypothetical protein